MCKENLCHCYIFQLRTVTLPLVLHGCKTWSLIIREQYKLRCSNVWCQGKYSGLRGRERRMKKTAERALQDYCSSPDDGCTIRSGWWDRQGTWHRGDRTEMHSAFWWGNLKERDHLQGLGISWEDNVKMDLKEVGWEGMDWTNLAQDMDNWQAAANMVMNVQFS